MPAFHATVDKIQEDHFEAAKSIVLKDDLLRTELERGITEDCYRLREFLQAARILNEVSPRSRDLIMGIGERLACRLVVAALEERLSLIHI